MTHQVFLKDSSAGLATIELTAGVYKLLNWSPNSAQLSSSGLNVNDLAAYDNVTESLDLRIHQAASKADVQAKLRAIESMIMLAQQRAINGFGPRVYLQVIIDGVGGTWQSEIIGGQVTVAPNALATWANIGADFNVQVERRFYWETEGTTSFLMTSSVDTAMIPATITNDHDANWVTFTPTEGSLPSPMTIICQNTGPDLFGSSQIYMSNNVFNDPAGLDPYFTDADLDVGTAAQTWASSTHDTDRWSWEIGASQLAKLAGGYFRILVGFTSLSNSLYVKASVYNTLNSTFFVSHEGEEVYAGTPVGSYQLLDLGALPLPPGGLTSGSDVGIGISVRSESSGFGTIGFMQIMPANSYRRLKKLGYNTGTNGFHFVDDGVNETVYSGSTSSQNPTIVGYGQPLMCWPGRLNKVSMLMDIGTSFPTTQTFEMNINYKPRRLSI